MNSPEQAPDIEATRSLVIGSQEHIILDESIKSIEFSIPREMYDAWPKGLATSFEVSEGRVFYELTEIDEDKDKKDLAVIRHRKNKEINIKTFLETDMMRGEKEKKIAIAAAASAITLATTGAAFLIVHKRKK